MEGLFCIIIILMLIVIWQHCSKEGFGMPAKPYTASIQTPAWMAQSPLLGFEDASTYKRSNTLMNRLGVSAKNEGFSNQLIRTNASGSFDQIRGY